MQNGFPELTPLQKAQQELIAISVSSDPAQNANAAQINGILMSCRLSALVEMVGANSPEFQKLFEDTCLAHVTKLTEQLKAQRLQPKIALAS